MAPVTDFNLAYLTTQAVKLVEIRIKNTVTKFAIWWSMGHKSDVFTQYVSMTEFGTRSKNEDNVGTK